jgi:alpha-tubulin suppressor-like RCC1 family protein
MIACGNNHSHLLTNDGSLYSIGSNDYGQLGLGIEFELLKFLSEPTLISDLKFK